MSLHLCDLHSMTFEELKTMAARVGFVVREGDTAEVLRGWLEHKRNEHREHMKDMPLALNEPSF